MRDQETALDWFNVRHMYSVLVSEMNALNYSEVADIIDRFVKGAGGLLEWDAYTMGVKFENPFLRFDTRPMSGTMDRVSANWEGSLH